MSEKKREKYIKVKVSFGVEKKENVVEFKRVLRLW